LTPLHHLIEAATQWAREVSALLGAITPLALDALVGIVTGALVLLVVSGIKRVRE
jgi:hypothetical protein